MQYRQMQMNNNPLLFFTQNDIPFPSAKLIIHNPTINELGLISEESFRIAHQMIINIPKELKSQGNSDLSKKDDFDIFIEVINQKDNKSIEYRNHLLSLLTLLFPKYRLRIREKDIQLLSISDNETFFIDTTNFADFQNIINNMFSFETTSSNDYNPADKRAEKIADKLRTRKKKGSGKVEDIKISIYRRYASILSIGMKIDLNIILNYTVCQLEVQFKRFTMWMKWENTFRMKMAGATNLEEVEDWMQEI